MEDTTRPSTKQPYEAPNLLRLGSLSELTEGAKSVDTQTDNAGTSN
jgi:hypothetical protein